MSLLLATFVVVGFGVAITFFELPAHARAVGKRSADCLNVLRDKSLSDQNKEEILRRESVELFRLLGILVGGSAIALLVPLVLVWLLGEIGVGSFSGTLTVLGRLDFLIGVCLVGSLVYALIVRQS